MTERCKFHPPSSYRDRIENGRIVTTCRICGAFIGSRPTPENDTRASSRSKRPTPEPEPEHEPTDAEGLF